MCILFCIGLHVVEEIQCNPSHVYFQEYHGTNSSHILHSDQPILRLRGNHIPQIQENFASIFKTGSLLNRLSVLFILLYCSPGPNIFHQKWIIPVCLTQSVIVLYSFSIAGELEMNQDCGTHRTILNYDDLVSRFSLK